MFVNRKLFTTTRKPAGFLGFSKLLLLDLFKPQVSSRRPKRLWRFAFPIVRRNEQWAHCCITTIVQVVVVERANDIIKVQGRNGVYRVRLGEFRIIYLVDEISHSICILTISRRSETTYK